MVISDVLSRASVAEGTDATFVDHCNEVTTLERMIVNAITNDAEKAFGDQKLNKFVAKEQIKINIM